MLFHEAGAPTREGLVDDLVIDHLTSLLSTGADAVAWSIDDARFTAVFLFSGMHGIVDDAYLREKRIVRAAWSSRYSGSVSEALYCIPMTVWSDVGRVWRTAAKHRSLIFPPHR
jgi:hypothetical protein